ncbi:hypothetical protein [Sorangium sp. So ce385]|uniref:hypothetical protein n=1 Tax=Sorangium sp. So ce385 TaxID=3133308 RepID=UPI003F5BC31D
MHLRYVSKFPFIAAVMGAAASVSLGACGGAGPVDDVAAGEAQELTTEGAEALTCPASVPVIDMRKSLIVTKETDPNILAEFPLGFVLQRLLTSVGSSQDPEVFYKRWWDTQNASSNAAFTDADAIHCDDETDSNGNPTLNGYPYTCPRNEGALARTDPLNPTLNSPFNPEGPNFMEPVALVNRFDLAPKEGGSHCGEYRIIYAKKSSSVVDRNFIIFEAQLPNPHPECGVAACLPVAEFWANLSDPNMTATQRQNALEGFYFYGRPELPGFEPVIKAAHFMAGTGQIRTNQFMASSGGFQPWVLREFKLELDNDSSPRLFVKPVTVKENPFPGLFNASFASDPRGAAFQSSFLDALDGLVPSGSDENDISLRTLPNQGLFNSGESIMDPGNPPHPNNNNYRARMQGNTAFAANIDAALGPILASRSLPPGMVTADNAADRATTQSCAGCHELSSRDDENVGGVHVWPAHAPTTAPGTFVHVNEDGEISDPLRWTFLPHRAQVLTSFIEAKACAAACSSEAASAASFAASADEVLLDGAEQVPTLGGSTTH